VVQAKKAPKPSPKFKIPTNPQQNPLQQVPDGYWGVENLQKNGGWQKVNPSTMKPGKQQETHTPLPKGYWGK
jgi:hypothetical protein